MYRGRPFAFSVRSAMLLLVVAAVVVFWGSRELHYHMMIDKLQREGCILEYDESPVTFELDRLLGRSRSIRGVTINSEGSTDQLEERDTDGCVLRVLATIRTLEFIQFHQKPLATFPNGIHFSNLKFLGFHNTVVDERTFPSGFCAEKLEHLEFSYTNVSDKELSCLKFPNLTTLIVRGSGRLITGDFLKSMAHKSNLEELDIVDSNLRFRNLRHLESFPNLRTLSIQFETLGFSRFPHLPRLLSLTLYVDHLDERLIAGLSHLESLSTLVVYPDTVSPDLVGVVRSNRHLELRGRARIEEYFDSFKKRPLSNPELDE